jgi:MoaA/NifB/PqqE/SkfB family radical SAM enzyme
MTIWTFVGLNRDWQVKFYYPKYPQKNKSWVSHEQKYDFECEDYFQKLYELPIDIIPFDFESIGIRNDISEVYKSDFLRWYLLSTEGGLWSDMDILYFKPMDSLSFNFPDNSHYDTGVCICKYGHSIGFMLASKNNLYYKYVWQRAKAAWNSENYQSIGSTLSNSLFPTTETIQRILPQLNPISIPMDSVYAYDALRIGEIYKTSSMERYTKNSIGLHWYAGHPLAGEFLKQTKGGVIDIPNNVLGKTLTALTTTSLPNYINKLIDKTGAILDLGSGTKVLAKSLNCKVTTVDIWQKFNPDLVWDLNNLPLPLEDESFDMVLLIDVIEHLEKENGRALLKEAMRLTKKYILLLTPLWWTDNADNMMLEDSPYYGNPYERHQSLWKREDFEGWKEVQELSFIGNYFIGLWEKSPKEITVEVEPPKVEEQEKAPKIDLLFDLSHACTYRCIFCRNSKLEQKFISLEQIKNIEELLAMAKTVDITGYGEVTAHPQFSTFLKYFKKFTIPVRFVTNGSMLTESLVEQIITSSVNEVVISVNSLNPDTYFKITGNRGNLSKVLAGVERLIKRNEEEKSGIRIIFSFVVTNYTLSEIKDFIDFAKNHNKEASLLDLTPTIKDYQEDLLVLDNVQNRTHLVTMKRYAYSIGAQVVIFNLDKRRAQKENTKHLSEIVTRCTWPFTLSAIGFDGTVGVCCWSTFSPGNIFSESFKSIWNGPKYNELRECIKKGDTKYCLNCRREG